MARVGDPDRYVAVAHGDTPGQAPGRLGSTPIVGAGTYASAARACSCTGDGEASLVRVAVDFGGHGGMVALDAGGAVAAATGTRAMPFAALSEDGRVVTGDLR